MTARRTRLHHLDLTTNPRAGMLDRLTRTRVLRPHRLEQVKDMLRAQCGPESQEMMVGIGKAPTTAKRDEARVSNLRQNHAGPSFPQP
jgi:hypothetical protein